MCIVLDKSPFLVIVSCIPSKTCEKQKYPYVIKDALDSQLKVIKFTICLPMVGGSLPILGDPASSTTKTDLPL
jgi:hypothetical protein